MATLTLTATTALEAVNRMLATIGEAPVNSLSTTGLGDVALAISALNEASREIQDRGWGFNSDENVVLPLDISGYIWVPLNVLRIKPEDGQGIRVTPRGAPQKLWDKDNLTYIWTRSDLKFRLVYLLDFDELPDVFRRYVAVKASRIFQQQAVASQVLERYTQADELEALTLCQDYDTDSQDFNMIYGNPTSYSMMLRDA